MTSLRVAVSPEIFDLVPGYRRAIVAVAGISNDPTPPELVDAVVSAAHSLHEGTTVEALLENERVEQWRSAFRSFGVNPSKSRPSVEALARRAIRGDGLPIISSIVDLGTYASLTHLMPIGAHATDHVDDSLELRLATGSERFVPFGMAEDASESPAPGEVIFTDADRVATRRWVWRQASHTSIAATTHSVEFNVDAVPAVSDAALSAATNDLAEKVERFLGKAPTIAILSAASQSTEVEVA